MNLSFQAFTGSMINWVELLNSTTYNDIDNLINSNSGKIGLEKKQEYFNKIASSINDKCEIINTSNTIPTDMINTIQSAIDQLRNSHSERIKKIVIVSTHFNDINTQKSICNAFSQEIENKKIKFIVFNIGVNDDNININNHLKCLVNDDSSKLFGLPLQVDNNKFWGATKSFQTGS